MGLQGPWAGLLRDTCTSQVRVGVPEAGRLPEQSGVPQVVGRHPQPWWAPRVAGSCFSAAATGAGEWWAHRGSQRRLCRALAFDVRCPELSRWAVEDTSPPPGGSLPGLGLRSRRSPHCGLAGRGREAGGELAWGHGVPCPSWVWPPTPPVRSAWWGPVFLGLGVGGLVPGAPQACLCPTPARGWPRPSPSPGPGPCQLTELLPGLLVGSGLLGRAGSSLAPPRAWLVPASGPRPGLHRLPPLALGQREGGPTCRQPPTHHRPELLTGRGSGGAAQLPSRRPQFCWPEHGAHGTPRGGGPLPVPRARLETRLSRAPRLHVSGPARSVQLPSGSRRGGRGFGPGGPLGPL